MTEGYPPQWQNDVQTGATGDSYTGTGQAAPGWGDGATTPAAAYGTDAGSTDDQSKTDAAKEQAAAVGQGAAQAGQQVASVAKDQAQNVVAEAGSQAKDLLAQARTELTEQAGTQQTRLAQGLHALGDELHAMTQHSESPGVATDLAKQAATRTHDAASWLESREPGNLLSELQSFARQRPGMFLALAAGAGLVAGRLGRGVKDATSDDSSSTPSAQSSGYAAPSGYEATVPNTGYANEGYSDTSYSNAGYAAPAPDASGYAPGYGTEQARPYASSQDAGYGEYPTGGAAL